MDSRRIVETSGAYSKERLVGEDRAWVKALDYVRDEVVDTFLANYVDGSGEGIRASLEREIVEEAFDDFREWLEIEAAEHTISFIESGDYPEK